MHTHGAINASETGTRRAGDGARDACGVDRRLLEQLSAAGVASFLGDDAALRSLVCSVRDVNAAHVIAVGLGAERGSSSAVLGLETLSDLEQRCGDTLAEAAPTLVVVGGAATAPSEALERLQTRALAHEYGSRLAVLLGSGADPGRARLLLYATTAGECTLFARTGLGETVPPAAVKSQVRASSTPLCDAPSGAPASPSIEVAVLGPVEIRGAHQELARHPRLTELVVYLAMHPSGVTSSVWSAALWPERRVPLQTVANRLSEARRALGIAEDRRPRLRKVADRHLLAETTTDWQRFSQLAAPNAHASKWLEALALVRGRPFANLPQGQWVTFEGFEAEIEQSIGECASRAGEECLRSGDPDRATWAAHQGLRATPYDERLYRLLMRAADAAGNRAGVEAAMRTLAVVLELDGDPLNGVHPDTAALYGRLTRRAPARRA